MSLIERKRQLKEDLETLTSWDDRFLYLIELGKQLPEFSSEKKNEESRVRGCQSDAWLVVEDRGGVIEMSGDADGLITKGMIALLIWLYGGIAVEEMRQEDFAILKEIGITEQLSMNRANGFTNMIEKIKTVCHSI
jgi:cysteine desulfuration protein SufE